MTQGTRRAALLGRDAAASPARPRRIRGWPWPCRSNREAEPGRSLAICRTTPCAGFNETSLVQTPRGDLVAFVRTEGEALRDHGVLIRSRDLGRTWEPWQDMQIVGHPYHHATDAARPSRAAGLRLSPQALRHPRPACWTPSAPTSSWPEIILRAEDGGSTDIGYPLGRGAGG